MEVVNRAKAIAGAMKPGKALDKLMEAERSVKRLTGRDDLRETEFWAVACLIADIGTSSFARSPLCRMIQDAYTRDDWFLARHEFYELAKLETSVRKQKRRKAEAELFSSPCLVAHNPKGKV